MTLDFMYSIPTNDYKLHDLSVQRAQKSLSFSPINEDSVTTTLVVQTSGVKVRIVTFIADKNSS